MKFRSASLSLVLLVLLSRLTAAPITPLSYSFNQWPGYGDETGGQLTNGVLADMSGGLTLASSYEFVGWDGGVPSITFEFGSTVTLDHVSLSFANWTGAAVYVPDQVKIGGDLFSILPASFDGNSHPAFTFAGSWTGSALTVDLISNYSRWIFVDEVSFHEGRGTGSTVPDSPMTLPLLAIAFVVLVCLRPGRTLAKRVLPFHGG